MYKIILSKLLFACSVLHIAPAHPNDGVIHGYGKLRLYGDRNWKGLLSFKDVDEDDGCMDLDVTEYQRVASVQVYGICVVLFSSYGCAGRSLRLTRSVDYLSLYKFENVAASLRACTPEEAVKPDPKPQFSIAKHAGFNDPYLHYYDLCWCTDIPLIFHDISAIHTHDNCLQVWDQPSCQGNLLTLRRDDKWHYNLALKDFNDKIRSLSVCPDFGDCIRLYGIVKSVNFDASNIKDLIYESPPSHRLELGFTDSLINHAKAAVTRDYTASRTVQEKYTFGIVGALRKFHSVSVDDGVTIMFTGSASDKDFSKKPNQTEPAEPPGSGGGGGGLLNNITGGLPGKLNTSGIGIPGTGITLPGLGGVKKPTKGGATKPTTSGVTKPTGGGGASKPTSSKTKTKKSKKKKGKYNKKTSKKVKKHAEQYDVDVPFFRERQFKTELKRALTHQTRAGSGWEGEWVARHFRKFSVKETFLIPKDSTFVVRSFVDMADNLYIPYEMDLVVHANDHARHMTGSEIIELLSERMINANVKDEQSGNSSRFVTVTVKGHIAATFGVRSYTEVDAKGIKSSFDDLKNLIPGLGDSE